MESAGGARGRAAGEAGVGWGRPARCAAGRHRAGGQGEQGQGQRGGGAGAQRARGGLLHWMMGGAAAPPRGRRRVHVALTFDQGAEQVKQVLPGQLVWDAAQEQLVLGLGRLDAHLQCGGGGAGSKVRGSGGGQGSSARMQAKACWHTASPRWAPPCGPGSRAAPACSACPAPSAPPPWCSTWRMGVCAGGGGG